MNKTLPLPFVSQQASDLQLARILGEMKAVLKYNQIENIFNWYYHCYTFV